MKKVFYYLIVLSFLISCDDNPLIQTWDGASFVAFREPSNQISVGEGDGSLILKVQLSPLPLSEDLTVNFEIEELSAIQGEHFTMNNQLVIPAGSVESNLVINIIDDEEFNESRRFVLTISSVSNNVDAGLISSTSTFRKEILIVNDDCPTKFNLWFGTVNVEDVGYPPAFNATGSGNSNGDCDILRIVASTNLVDWTTGAISSVPHDFVFSPDFPGSSTGLVEIPETLIGSATFNFPGGAGPGDVLYTITYGEYNEITKIIEVDYVVRVRRLSDGAMFNLTGWSGTNRIIKP